MVHENMLEKSGHSTQPKPLHMRECEYSLFDTLQQYLMNPRALHKFVVLGLETSKHVPLWLSLARGGGEASIDRRIDLRSVFVLPRGGRCTFRPDTSLSKTVDTSEKPSPQQTKETRLKLARTSEQVPFNESEWALRHFLEHPELRSRMKNLLLDTLLNTIQATSRLIVTCPKYPDMCKTESNLGAKIFVQDFSFVLF